MKSENLQMHCISQHIKSSTNMKETHYIWFVKPQRRKVCFNVPAFGFSINNYIEWGHWQFSFLEGLRWWKVEINDGSDSFRCGKIWKSAFKGDMLSLLHSWLLLFLRQIYRKKKTPTPPENMIDAKL